MARSRKLLTIGAVSVAAFALAASTSVTGAYFTDSHNGTINASTGLVHVDPTTTLELNFTNLLPGEFQTRHLTFTASGSAREDIWLVLPTDGAAKFLNGVPAAPTEPFPLGRYGHFAVNSNAGSFTSYNLASPRVTNPVTLPCYFDKYGHGGSNAQAATAGIGSADTIDYCPVPNAILLSNNLKAGDKGYADVTFGFTKLLKDGQNSALDLVAPFKIVATQHGILPGDPNNAIK